MRKFSRGEYGAVSNYIIGIIFLIIVLIGSVIFLKGLGERNLNRDRDDHEVIYTEESGEDIGLDNEQNNDNDNDEDSQNDVEGNDNNGSGANQDDSASQNGTQADTATTPEEIPVTGPGETAAMILGVLFAFGGIYAIKEFYLSRVSVKKSLLK